MQAVIVVVLQIFGFATTVALKLPLGRTRGKAGREQDRAKWRCADEDIRVRVFGHLSRRRRARVGSGARAEARRDYIRPWELWKRQAMGK
jgi:hypothetical protein